MNLKIIGLVLFFLILISLQYTLNKILKELKDIKKWLKIIPARERRDDFDRD